MPVLHDIAYFFAGAVLTNAIPHFVSGVMGKPFQSPFAKPPGKGLSSSTINVLWGFFNIAAGYALLLPGVFDLRLVTDVGAFGLGTLLMALFMARHFGRLHGGNAPEVS